MNVIFILLGIIIIGFMVEKFIIQPKSHAIKTLNLHSRLVNLKHFNKRKYSGKGLVTYMNTNQIKNCLVMISSVRKYSNIPITVFIDNDFCYQGIFKKYPAVKTKKINCSDWNKNIKCILESDYSDVIYCEPDLIFLDSVEKLFGQHYNMTGLCFWKTPKSTIKGGRMLKWIKTLIPYKIKENWILNNESNQFQSRDIVLVNKKNKAFLNKLKLMMDEEKVIKEYLYSADVFWLAAELAKLKYFFNEEPGIIGNKNFGGICGGIIHSDMTGSPLCFKADIDSFNDYTHWATPSKESVWLNMYNICLNNITAYELTTEMKNLLNSYAHIVYKANEEILANKPIVDK